MRTIGKVFTKPVNAAAGAEEQPPMELPEDIDGMDQNKEENASADKSKRGRNKPSEVKEE
ncbi:MAG: hypothetical protein IJ368_03695 [Oscillospiraceae bacterium]|nr:hypothetical protein [Oscillospiraceae bacterium]